MGDRHSDGKHAIFISVIQYLAELSVVLLVLFHDYGTKDTTVVVSLLIAAYGLLSARISGEGALSAAYFRELSKAIRGNGAVTSQKITEGEANVLETLSRREIPYVGAFVIFHLVLASIAVIRLLLALFL
jgi:hypothetical protein